MKMNAKQLGERIAVVEKELGEAKARVDAQANAPMAMNAVAMCEKPAPRPSKAERRGKLVAAHVALEAVSFDVGGYGDYGDYESLRKTQQSICAAIGRLELED